ncbi:DNA cytosine methyltransferase [Thermoactinomyces sp. DSM 45892]|uniref:DNA cytosine methyltransferase n=1 Tax=Thermoactinomyces sp. DSM 45892 TaxID=1882753 RepID=UPI00089AC6E0|nr:DNA cytosine methyltransferase [Thermoactinomyces sp. DSM 45892]SDX95737.1 DNA (cytosine-5)-methyltransferase 1 [Thermoactinomyces sp. DSM 45892]
MKVLDLFAGVGGFRLGMEMAGHQTVGWVEIDRFARESYEAIHKPKGEWTHDDIATVDHNDLPTADIWTFGFPCQDISVAGSRSGFKGSRSSLFFSVTKLLREIKKEDSSQLPSYLIIENVKNFLAVNGGWDFLATQIELDEIGYNLEWQVLNSRDHRVAQNRERIFIIGHLRGRDTRKVLPIGSNNKQTALKQVGVLTGQKFKQSARVYSPKGISPTLCAKGDAPKILVETSQGERSVTIHNLERLKKLAKSGYRLRRLTPLECWRAQGFPDWAFHRARDAGISDTQLYRQAGNTVTVPVVYEIAKRIPI